MQTTMEEVRSLVKVLEELVQPLLEGEVVEDTYESNKSTKRWMVRSATE